MKYVYFLFLLILITPNIVFAEDIISNNVCRTEQLTPQQVQSLKDNYLLAGIRPNQISSGAPANTKDINSSINVINADGSAGISFDLPNVEQPVSGRDYELHESCTGDFVYAMTLTDSLRVGRCIVQDNPMNCSVEDGGLKYRNAEDSIDLVKNSLKNLLPFTSSSSSLDTSDVSENELPLPNAQNESVISNISGEVRELLGSPDLAELEYQQPVRQDTDVIPNHIKADSFFGEFQSICIGETASKRCQIILLSYFDKYYNAYYSGIALGTAAGPLIIGGGSKVLSSLSERKAFGGAFRLSEDVSKIVPDVLTPSFWSKKISTLFERDAKVLASNIKLQHESLANDGFAKILADLEGLGLKLPKEAQPKFNEEILKAFAGKPLAAKAFYNLIERRATLLQLTESSFKSAKTANATPDELRKILWGGLGESKSSGANVVEKILGERSQYNGLNFAPDGTKDIKFFFKELMGDTRPTIYVQDMVGGRTVNFLDKAGLSATLQQYPKEVFYIKNFDGVRIPVTASTYEGMKGFIPDTGITGMVGGRVTYAPHPNSDILVDDMRNYFLNRGERFVTEIRTNQDNFLGAMKDSGLVPKGFANPMTQAMRDTSLIYNKSQIGKTLGTIGIPIIYWKVKTSDTGFKAYFIGKDEYSNVAFSLGQGPIYNDAYIDVFVNDPVGNGDFFGMTFAKMSDILSTLDLKEYVDDILGLISRDEVKDVLYYTGTRDDCPNCASSFKLVNGNAIVNTRGVNNTFNYFLELPDKDTFERDGLTLAVFAHHTDIDLKNKDVSTKINIESAINTGESCRQKVKELPLFVGSIMDVINPKAASTFGAALGIADNTSLMLLPALGLTGGFFPGLMFGTVFSLLLNKLFTEKLDGCIDNEDGYYAQYIYRVDKSETDKIASLSDLLGRGETVQTQPTDSDVFSSTMNEIKDALEQSISNTDKEFLQFYLETYGSAIGKMETSSLSFRRLNGGSYCSPNSYDDESYIVMSDGDNNVEIDKENGTISINGNVILDSPLVRTATRNLVVGALEIAQSATYVPLGNVDIFELSGVGDIKVIDPNALSCLVDGLRIQTGKTLTGNSLSNIMGVVKEISTKEGTTLIPNVSGFDAIGGVLERQSYIGSVIVDKQAKLVKNNSGSIISFGQLDSIITERGLILYIEKSKEFFVWARIIAQMDWDQIAKLNVTPTTVKNPETNCDEVALNMNVVPIANDVMAQASGVEMNAALDKAGPYQYFETPNKTFIFYSKLVDGQCKSFMKVVDKTSGEVITDSEITSVLQTPNGVSLTTADGKTHSLEFTAENGRPILSYNGEKAPLLLAQGRNGSFYFDPKTGKWTVSNSQMLPLNDEFRENGYNNVGGVATPGTNPFVNRSDTISRQGVFDIPLIDYGTRLWFLLLMLLVSTIIFYKKN